ncbi:DinB family protein [Nocardia sp. GTS18]|uniref:DinB family protein n=1 Tax=Nocardia sp. GTS18 TaxID=1778064 RepID=UPI0015EF1E32|nr:DinB family protein [Nocardia sp. GTS18]
MKTERITSGGERMLLENMLDRNREALIDTARGLSETDARRRLVPSLTTPISLLKHAAGAERIWFQRFWAGLAESECDGYSRRDEGTFAVSDDESLADVIAEFERASRRSRDIAARFDLDDTLDIPGEGKVSMRWTLLAMIEEFARHAGHGDILREQIRRNSAHAYPNSSASPISNPSGPRT